MIRKVCIMLWGVACVLIVAWAWAYFTTGWVVNDDDRAKPVASAFMELSCKITGGTFFEDYSCGYGEYPEE